MKASKKLILCMSSIILVVALILSFATFANAEDVVVEEYKDTSLEFASIWGQPDGATNAVWKNKDEYIEDLSIKNYKIRSNAFAPWFEKDCVSFAYKKMDFAYGKQGTLTVETQLNSWDAKMSAEAGAGIMLRTSNAPGAVNLMFHVRPSRIMATYRALEDGSSVRSKMITGEIAYPVSFKVVLNNNKATCFIKQANQKAYSSFAAIPFVCGNTVLAGIAAYSQYEDEIATADFTGFHSYITTPEGAERVEGDGEEGGEEGSTSSGTTSSEEIKLPEDAPVQENVLLNETFTDGTLTHEKEILPSQVNWKYNTTYEPGIVLNSDNTNRYMYDWMVSDRYYFGGDQHWSDYTMTMDLTFTDEYSMEEANCLEVYVRHNDIAQYGVHNYGVSFNMVGSKQYISLVKRAGGKFTTFGTKVTKVDEANDKVVTVEVEKEYLPVTKEDVKTKQLKIRAFDNKITVWYDGELIIDYIDESSDIKGFGSIGWQVKASAVQIDNIKVVKETDVLGGDYDNEVCGNWDEPIPELIQLYDENEWER